MRRLGLLLFALVIATALAAAGEPSVRIDRSSLYVRNGDGTEVRLDAAINPGSPYAFARFEDGSALLIYRGHAADETRDLQVSRYDEGRWSPPHALNVDDWRSVASTSEGPALAVNGGRAAVAWFTAAGDDPRVLLSLSPDAGGRFTLPIRVSEKPALGRVSVLLLHDGAMLVTWVDATGSLLFRRVALNLSPDPITPLISSPVAAITGVPRLELIKDYDQTPARLSISFTTAASPEPETHVYTLPSLSSLSGRQPCAACDEQDAKAMRGFALHARIVGLSVDHRVLTIEHNGLPGVMRAQTLACQIDPATLPPGLATGGEILARIERRGRAWWIFDVRLLRESGH